MNTITYKKLVRDRIPEIIEAEGKIPHTSILSDEEYLKMLDKKLLEETAEYCESGTLEELADVTEVLYSILSARGYSPNDLEQAWLKKAAERGGLEKKILLKDVVVP